MQRPLLGGWVALAVLVASGMPVWAQAAGVANVAGAAVVYADRVTRTDQAGFSVLELLGNVVISRGEQRLQSDRAVIFVNLARSAQTGKVILDCYAEGNVVTYEHGAVVESQRAYFSWELARLSVDDENGKIEQVQTPPEAALLERAEEARARGAVEPMPAPARVPEATIRRYVAVAELQPMRFGTIYAQQQVAPEIEVRREGDTLITVATGQPDILFYDPDPRMGQLELLADNLVIWLNDKVMTETGDARKADLQIYAEGHVRLYHQGRIITCEQMFYDYGKQQALLVGGVGGDAVIKGYYRQRNLPIYFRAKEFRQLSRTRFQADRAHITTCEFGHPHWSMSTGRMEVVIGREEVAGPEGEPETGPVTERATFYNSFFEVRGVPLAYVPVWTHSLRRDRTPLSRLSFNHSSKFGTEIRTGWDPYAFHLYENDWSDVTIVADWLSKRGVGVGLDANYARETFYGSLRSYYIKDQAKQDSNDSVFPREDRGWVHWMDRRRLSEHWRVDFEFSFISDADFLNEYFQQELNQQKEKENIAFLHYTRDNFGLTLLGKWRVNDFLTVVERQPELRTLWIGQPLLDNRLVYTTDNTLANLRRRQSEDLPGPPGSFDSLRADTQHELQLPLDAGPVKVSPFVAAEYTYYDEDLTGDSIDRTLLTAGARGSTAWWRVYDVQSRLWDLNGLRHIVTPQVTYADTFSSSTPASDLLQFDDIDSRDKFQVVNFHMRNRLQTKRSVRPPTDAEPAVYGVTEWMRLDSDINYFPDPDRDNAGRSFSNLILKYRFQVTDRVAILSNVGIDLDDRKSLETFDFGFDVNRSPRLAFYLGERYTRADRSNELIGRVEYRIDERYTVGMLGIIDIGNGHAEELRVTLTRRLHRWLMRVGFERDLGQDDTSVLLEFVPQGIPEATLRFF